MNTMADGARDRLVAQIGEALFGQPGLTLMELAEKVKGMRSPFLIEEEPLPADMRLGSVDYIDYLNDQPSPAGQGELSDLVERWREASLEGGPSARHYIAGLRACAGELEAALAARQPVDPDRGHIDPSWSLHDRVEFALRDAGFDLDEAAFVAEAADRARQPVESR